MVLTIPQPNPKQKIFLKDKHRYIAYGGARGGGKSWAVRIKALLDGVKYPGLKQVIIRRSYPELYSNHIKPFLELLPIGFYKYADGKKEITLPNGSTIMFRYCSNDKDLLNFQGTEADIMYIDEAGQFTYEQFLQLNACVRGVNGFPKQTVLTCNPGGTGHDWIKRLFVSKDYRASENPDDYIFIPALVYDNKALMAEQPDYIKQLEILPPKLKEAWLNGNWDIFEGMFFEDFVTSPSPSDCEKAGLTVEQAKQQHKWTHVIAPFQPYPTWEIYRSYDFGYAKPFSVMWYAIDYDGRIYHILEYYGCTANANEGVKMTPDEQFQEVARIEREHPYLKGKDIHGVADPSIWDTSRGISVAETAMKYGIYFQEGDNHRIQGWMQCHYRLRFDKNGYPMFYVFDTCKNFIRTIPSLMYSEKRPEDLDTEGEDHIADSWRYMLMTRPIVPQYEEPKPVVMGDPLNQFN